MKPKYAGRFLVWSAAVALASAPTTEAHEGPEHEIEELTAQIQSGGATSDLLLQRAIEYRVLGQLHSAMKDLEDAGRTDASDHRIGRELAKVQFSLGKTNEALATMTRALEKPEISKEEKAGSLMIRSGFLAARSELKKALVDNHQAIELYDSNPEWYLQRSVLQGLLKQTKERISGIDTGLAKTGAGVLMVEKVIALLADSQYSAALALIEPELESSRIKSSWLLRRAQARIGLGDKEKAKADLEESLSEIRPRLNPTAPDVSLLLDRSLAHELLGDLVLAKHYYEQASEAGGETWVKEKIKSLKAQIAKTNSSVGGGDETE